MLKNEKITSVFISIRSSLVRSVTRIVPPKEVEDIVQETYVRVCQACNSSEIVAPSSFMFKTARNIALNHVNRAESRLVQSFDDIEGVNESNFIGSSIDAMEQVSTDQEFALFCKAVRLLPLQCRRVFVLKKVYGHSQKEIAATLKISEKTVEKHIANGIKRCREYMKNGESQPGNERSHIMQDVSGDKT